MERQYLDSRRRSLSVRRRTRQLDVPGGKRPPAIHSRTRRMMSCSISTTCGMSDETRELHRIIRASVRDMLDAYRIQAQAGPVSDQAPEEIIFRGRIRSWTASRPTRPRSGLRSCRASCACSWRASLRPWRER